jgi:hypothetical protein
VAEQSDFMSKNDKKSDVLEVRVPHETKKAFMYACRERGQTASAVLRESVDTYLSGNQRGKGYVGVWAGLTFSLIAFASFVFWYDEPAAPELVNPLAVGYFEQADANKDLRISSAELLAAISKRGTTRSENIEPDKIVVSNGSVSLLFPVSSWDILKAANLADDCFKTIEGIANAEHAREFYQLDKDKDNELTFNEFMLSQRIPTMKSVFDEFTLKDKDEDGFLSRSEASEPREAYLNAYATHSNSRTTTKFLGVPEGCITEGTEPTDGHVRIRFEQLKRPIEILSADAELLEDGLTEQRFLHLDENQDQHLSFQEFLEWFLIIQLADQSTVG